MIHGTSKIVALAIEQNSIHRIGPCQIGKEIAGKKDCVGERRYGRRCVGAYRRNVTPKFDFTALALALFALITANCTTSRRRTASCSSI